jgi:hypothetical protein
MSILVWYTAYGSNLCAERFLVYIKGSDGSIWPAARGCRDQAPAKRSIFAKIPGQIYFAGHSKNWDNGGVAFYDPTVNDSDIPARMYLVALDQFNDIFLQENDLAQGDITEIVNGLGINSSVIYGDSWYREIWRLADVEGYPALTFTSPVRMHEAELVAPSQKYLDVIAKGLTESRELGCDEIRAYLDSLVKLRPFVD